MLSEGLGRTSLLYLGLEGGDLYLLGLHCLNKKRNEASVVNLAMTLGGPRHELRQDSLDVLGDDTDLS